MDRTVLYREIVRIALDGEPEPSTVPPVEPDAFTNEVNSIAATLYRLQASLKQIRPRYLAMTGIQQMSDSEKDDFDYTVRQILQGEQRRVRALEQREAARCAAEKPQGFAARWLSNPTAEGSAETLAKHRQGMFFKLNSLLQQGSQSLAELHSVRNARSIVSKPVARVASVDPARNAERNAERSAEPNAELNGSEQQQQQQQQPDDLEDEIPESHMQLLLEEHDVLLEDLNARLEKAQRAEQSLREVADLQEELTQHLSSQSQQLESLTTDAFRTTKDISGANEQLERAKRSSKRASRIVIISSVATGVFLLLLNGR